MKKIIVPVLLVVVIFTSCKKNDNNNSTQDFNTTKDAAISDFVSKVAIPGYTELKTKAATLNTAIIELNTNTTEPNLTAAKAAWKDIRITWERCEGFLFGPIEDNEYDPETDTWPVNYVDMDALLASSDPLGVADIEALTSRALKGYHPIEYILWGEGGTRTAASLTARQKEYVLSLSALIKINADHLYNDWDPASGNYSNKFLTAGTGSTVFPKKQDAFLAIAQGMINICAEVGEGKMKEPFDLAATDPAGAAQIVESPFSSNSLIDFKNNITGAFNVYLGKFNADGTGLEDLVKAKNSALDIELQEKFNTAVQSFNNITLPFEQAIVTQRTQCAATMDTIDELASTIDSKLVPFINQYITD